MRYKRPLDAVIDMKKTGLQIPHHSLHASHHDITNPPTCKEIYGWV